jgi:hypothetical protein
MGLTFQPESDESAVARMPAALRRLFVLADIERDPSQRPGLMHEHVFDFQDGMRMIVSREDWEAHGIKIHCSFSWFGPVPPSLAAAKALIMERLRAVVGFTGLQTSVMIFVTKKGVLHYAFAEDQVTNTWS